jgi:hypothetical protein
MTVEPIPCHDFSVKRIALLIVLALIAVACGEAGLLDGAGDRTRVYAQGPTTTTLAVPSVPIGAAGESAVASVDVLWFNDQKDPQFRGEPEDVVADVWSGRIGNSRFVQSSRGEIADALPLLMFPALLPDQVLWVTSQLVYDEVSGTLDPDTSAAFGLWTTDPYQSDTGRLGVLRVGRTATDAIRQRSQMISVVVPDGLSLGWTEESMRYELFCRSEVSQELCIEIAESFTTMSDLLPDQ